MRKMRTSELHSRVRKDKKMRFLAVGMCLAGMSKPVTGLGFLAPGGEVKSDALPVANKLSV